MEIFSLCLLAKKILQGYKDIGLREEEIYYSPSYFREKLY
jgi:hypothetical protein